METSTGHYFSKTLETPYANAIGHVTAALTEKGFGVLTTVDVRSTSERKLDVELQPYTILGACDPQFAYEALQMEDAIGTMLPSNVVVHEVVEGLVEVLAVDPVASMAAVGNPALAAISGEVQDLLKQVVASL